MDRLAKLGVVSLDVRSRLFQALVDSKSSAEKEELRQKIDVNSKYGSLFDGLERSRNEKITKLEDFKVAYEQAESDASTKFSHKFIVQSAEVADRKDQPKRMILTIVAAIGSFIFIVFCLLILERYRELKRLLKMALNKKISLTIALFLLTALFTLFNWFYLEYLALFPVALLFVYLAIFQTEKFFLFIAFLTPLSVNIEEYVDGFGLYLPTEPLLFWVHALVSVFTT